nr:MAG TPA: hypothetical protein [Bacteriophage sp.]
MILFLTVRTADNTVHMISILKSESMNVWVV